MKDLYKKEQSKEFYDNRYLNGYLDDWSIAKKQRVFEMIRNLSLPETGMALDFGCGNGIFTDVLRKALPLWQIYGCDISSNAILPAQDRFPGCSFFVSDNEPPFDWKFDFVFSHHVLEHVCDIKKTIEEIDRYLKPKSFILHILPCGNADSFQFKICKMRMDGINDDMEGRFVFEDEGHLRRLTTEQLNTLMSQFKFILVNEFYGDQRYHTIKMISQSSFKVISLFTNPKRAIDKKAFIYLTILRLKLNLLFIVQMPALLYSSLKHVKNVKLRHYFYYCVGFVPFCISYPIVAIVNHRAKKEWELERYSRNASEMYLFYMRK